MIDGPYVTLSSAISLDGYLDTANPPRLALSNAADFDRVDEVRAGQRRHPRGGTHRATRQSETAGPERRSAEST